MKKIYTIILFFILFSLPLFSFSQPSDIKVIQDTAKEFNKIISKGNMYFYNFDYKNSIVQYEKAYLLNRQDYNLLFQLGFCYYSIYDVKNAVFYFSEAEKYKTNQIDDLNYYLAISLHDNYNFAEAIKYYKKTLDDGDTSKTEFVKLSIKNCKNGLEILKDTLDYKVFNVDKIINSIYDDYGLFIFPNDSLCLFTTKRPENVGGFINYYDGNYFEDILLGFYIDSAFSNIYNPGIKINTVNNDACIGVSSNPKCMYIYSEINNGDVFYSYYNDTTQKWTRPNALNIINSEFQESSIAVVGDMQHIYFVSDRAETLGGKDIFYIKKNNDNTFSKPLNIGKNINSELDEECIFINQTNDKMYFSSKGHNSMGGFDVFISTKNNKGEWQKAKNLGFPINSPNDDMFFCPYKNKFFLSSVRPETIGKSDIYCIEKVDYFYTLKEEVKQDLFWFF